MCSLPSLVILIVAAAANARNAPIVKTNYGSVRGKWLSARDISIAAYLGIPYAEPPVGQLRFESPKPWTEEWSDTRDATEDGAMCVQLEYDGTTRGLEDCLNLNIFVPLILPKRSLPVLVFIHGGGFNKGSNNSTYFAPDYLLDREVVLVTVNYRLNVFGFLSTGTERVAGNAGLKDIREALKWLQENVAHFGGDPNATTLFGHSSGAAAVHHLALSQSTEGLFDKFITHSGSALAPWATHPPFLMRIKYLLIAKELGCTTDYEALDFEEYLAKESNDQAAYARALLEDEEILKCLRQLRPSRLVHADNLLHVWHVTPWCNFGPTVELQSEDAIITKHPLRTIREGEFRDIPWITGVVEDEGLLKTKHLFINPELMNHLMKNFETLGVYFLESQEVVANASYFTNALIEFYIPNGTEAVANRSMDYEFTLMVGDGLFTWYSYQALDSQANSMNASVYSYLFSYEGTFSSTYIDGIPLRYGVAHFDDINYLFPCLNNKFADIQLRNTGSDWTMVNVMTELWTNFAKYGVPSARQIPQWEPYQVSNRFMRIGFGKSVDLAMEENFLSDRMNFWESLMGNVSYPLDKFFLENEEEAPSELEQDRGGAAESSGTRSRAYATQSPFVIFIFMTFVWYLDDDR